MKSEPNKFIKFARIARTTGKSLRASPAFYEWRWALDMKLIVLTGALLQLLGCAATPKASSPENAIGCTLESARYYPKLAGLIVMPNEEAWKLLSQIPADARGNAFCWYQLRSGNLEARYGYDQYGYARGVFRLPNGAPKNGGYEFERQDDGWHFVRLNEHILLERHY